MAFVFGSGAPVSAFLLHEAMRARANRDDARINVCVRYMRGFLAVARCEARRLRRRSMWGDCPRRHGVHRCASARHSRLNTAHGEVRLEERGVDVVDHGCCEYLSGRGRRVHGSSDDGDCGRTGQPPCNVRSLPPPPTLPPHTQHTRAIVAKRPKREREGARGTESRCSCAPAHPPATCPPACMRRPLGLRARARAPAPRQGLRAGFARVLHLAFPLLLLPPTPPHPPPPHPHHTHLGSRGVWRQRRPHSAAAPAAAAAAKLTRERSQCELTCRPPTFFFFKRRWVGFLHAPGRAGSSARSHIPIDVQMPVCGHGTCQIALGSDE